MLHSNIWLWCNIVSGIMCGIWALFGMETHTSVHSNTSFSRISHRGPDAWRIEFDKKVKVMWCFLRYVMSIKCDFMKK